MQLIYFISETNEYTTNFRKNYEQIRTLQLLLFDYATLNFTLSQPTFKDITLQMSEAMQAYNSDIYNMLHRYRFCHFLCRTGQLSLSSTILRQLLLLLSVCSCIAKITLKIDIYWFLCKHRRWIRFCRQREIGKITHHSSSEREEETVLQEAGNDRSLRRGSFDEAGCPGGSLLERIRSHRHDAESAVRLLET